MFSENDFKKYIPQIIDVYEELLGKKYKNIITERTSNLEYCIYDNIHNFGLYYSFLLKCKQRELSIRFLQLMGIDVSKNNNKTFFYELESDLNSLVSNFMGNYSQVLELLGENNYYGALSFEPQFSHLKDLRVEFINFLRDFLDDSSIPNVTVDTLDDFYNTEHYNKIKPHIDLAIKSYETILSEYNQYKISLTPYIKSIKHKEKLKPVIYELKKQEFFRQISHFLPFKLRIQMLKNNLTIYDIFSSSDPLHEKSDIEFFSEFDNIELDDSNVDEYIKQEIISFRLNYFKLFNIDDNLYSYDEIVKKYKNLIPSEKFIEKIIELRKEKLDEIPREYCKAINPDSHSSYLTDYDAYNKMCDDSICITTTVSKDFKAFYPTLFFTHNSEDEGSLDFILLHEFFHLITFFIYNNNLLSGFDVVISNSTLEMNPYNKQKRKYEILNENITDIFAIEALKILRSKDIYFLEPKNTTRNIEDFEILNRNTHPLTRKVLKPFVFKYKPQLARALFTGNFFQLFCQIDEKNFELLNISINKLDYLLRKNNILSINIPDCDDFNLINSQLERIEQIYNLMNQYKSIQQDTIAIKNLKNNYLLKESENNKSER